MAARELLWGEAELNDVEIEIRADSLSKEAGEKLRNWRGEVIKATLKNADGQKRKDHVVRVIRAATLLDGYHDNGFRRLKILRKRLRYLVAFALSVTIVYCSLAGVLLPMLDKGNVQVAPSIIALLGLLGAILSALVSTKSASDARVPVQQAQAAVLFGRLALGPLAAVITVTLLCTGVINGYQPDNKMAVAAAIVSGFSERFVVSAINAFAKSE